MKMGVSSGNNADVREQANASASISDEKLSAGSSDCPS